MSTYFGGFKEACERVDLGDLSYREKLNVQQYKYITTLRKDSYWNNTRSDMGSYDEQWYGDKKKRDARIREIKDASLKLRNINKQATTDEVERWLKESIEKKDYATWTSWFKFYWMGLFDNATHKAIVFRQEAHIGILCAQFATVHEEVRKLSEADQEAYVHVTPLSPEELMAQIREHAAEIQYLMDQTIRILHTRQNRVPGHQDLLDMMRVSKCPIDDLQKRIYDHFYGPLSTDYDFFDEESLFKEEQGDSYYVVNKMEMAQHSLEGLLNCTAIMETCIGRVSIMLSCQLMDSVSANDEMPFKIFLILLNLLIAVGNLVWWWINESPNFVDAFVAFNEEDSA